MSNPKGINQYTQRSAADQLMSQKSRRKKSSGGSRGLHPDVLQSLHNRSSGYKPAGGLHPDVVRSLRARSGRK